MESLEEKRDRLVDDLSIIEDPHERLAYIIDIGKSSDGLSEELQIDKYRIEGCISNLWLVPAEKNGKCFYTADSDAMITKGFASLLCNLYSGHSPEEILKINPEFLADVGVTQHLSPNRRNGLTQVGERIVSFAKIVANS
ncbi:MAG: SufE family protein [Opitutales bacterium]|nr:SufE family protein [Opitutales bacterium]